jgi:hypothetical protein
MLNSVKLAFIIYSTGWLSSVPSLSVLRTGFEGVRRFYSLIQGTEGLNRLTLSEIRLVRSEYILSFCNFILYCRCAAHSTLHHIKLRVAKEQL